MENVPVESLFTEAAPIENISPENPLTEDISPENPVIEDISPENPVIEDISPENPATEDVSTETPFTEDISPENPLTENISPENPATEDVPTETPFTEDISPETPSPETLPRDTASDLFASDIDTSTPLSSPAQDFPEEPALSSTEEDFSVDAPSSSISASEPLAPESSYQPTPDAFAQTVNALNTVKEEGNSFISSEELPSQPYPSESDPEKVLNLDQMVAKFTGDELPIQQDPFEPMKKALEEEEKKELNKKGVAIDGIPLIVSPEQVPESLDAPAPIEDPAFTPHQEEKIDEIPIAPPMTAYAEEISDPLPDTSPETATLSLDEIIDTANVPVNSSPSPVPRVIAMDINIKQILEKLKNPRVLAGIGGGLVMIFVMITMFPTLFSSPSVPSQESPSEIITPPSDIPESPTVITTDPPLTPDLPPVEEPVIPSQPSQPFPDNPEPTHPAAETDSGGNTSPLFPEDPEGGQPFIDDPLPVEPTPPQITSQEMISTLTELSNNGSRYLEIGEKDNDLFLIKHAGYIRFQAGILIKQLEN
jgi:hypothetical protein